MKDTQKQARGELTARIKEKSKKLFGYEISQKELRLMPFIQYTLMNERRIKFEHIDADEVAILESWHEKGFVTFMTTSGMFVSINKDFWNNMNEILFLGYVDLHQ